MEVLNTGAYKIFEKIYKNNEKAEVQNKSLKNLFKIYGINSKREGWNYLVWKVFKKGKYNPRDKKH